MNLVDLIKDQLSSGVIKHLSSQIDASEGATRSAVFAAVPALLQALSGLTASNSGSQKLVSALEQFGSGSIEGLVHKMSDHPSSVLEQGASILSSLFGSSTISGIVNILSRFASIAPGATQKLLGYVTPLILGAIASKFSGRSIDAQGLANLFADQKSSIASALPSGLSLADVPGLTAASSAVRSAAREVETRTPSLWKWLLPIAGIAAAAALLWTFLPSSTPVPEVANPATVTRAQSHDFVIKGGNSDVSELKTELTDTFSKLTEALTSVKDVPSAETALPKLEDLAAKLRSAKTTMKDLAADGKATIVSLVKATETKLLELIEKVLAIPGVGDKIKVVADSIKAKLSDLAG